MVAGKRLQCMTFQEIRITNMALSGWIEPE
jgi:hypothetical protein